MNLRLNRFLAHQNRRYYSIARTGALELSKDEGA